MAGGYTNQYDWNGTRVPMVIGNEDDDENANSRRGFDAIAPGTAAFIPPNIGMDSMTRRNMSWTGENNHGGGRHGHAPQNIYNIFVGHLHIMHPPPAVAGAVPAYVPPPQPVLMRPNHPQFALASMCSHGAVDFGAALAQAFYTARRHVDEGRNFVTYTQDSSSVQRMARAAALGLSSRRTKHAVFLFDAGLLIHRREIISDWADEIHLRHIETLIRGLGSGYEYARKKVITEMNH